MIRQVEFGCEKAEHSSGSTPALAALTASFSVHRVLPAPAPGGRQTHGAGEDGGREAEIEKRLLFS